MSRKNTQSEFIQKAISRWGDRYDYSNVVYVNNKTEIEIICKEHGPFMKRPDVFLSGTGCPKCSRTKKSTTEEFIEKANYVHNGFFNYDKTVYTTSGNKVIVTCPYHGDFEVKANNHLNGCNCKKCSEDGFTHKITKLTKDSSSTKTYDTYEFIRRAKAKWGDKYTYDNVVYTKNNKHVNVTCRKHGDFSITPNHFLNGRGCPHCSNNYNYTTNEFINKLKELYGDKYYYDRVNYVRTHDDIEIGCKKHGYFKIRPSNLLKGEGCPNCNQSIMEEDIKMFLTSHNINYMWQYKIGRLRLDFFLPDYNIGIECQGIQHFKPVEMFGGEDAFIDQTRRDELKKNLCKKNNVYLLYYANYQYEFPYEVITSKDELLNKILNYKQND